MWHVALSVAATKDEGLAQRHWVAVSRHSCSTEMDRGCAIMWHVALSVAATDDDGLAQRRWL